MRDRKFIKQIVEVWLSGNRKRELRCKRREE